MQQTRPSYVCRLRKIKRNKYFIDLILHPPHTDTFQLHFISSLTRKKFMSPYLPPLHPSQQSSRRLSKLSTHGYQYMPNPFFDRVIQILISSYLLTILKPTGYLMHQQVLTFNNCTLCPHCIYVFCIYLRTNSDLCHLQHKLIGFYNRDEKCLQRGTDWVFK